MCQKRNSKKVTLKKNKVVRLDDCLACLILYLNIYGIKTIASCCGHGRYPITIIADFDGEKKDIMSNIIIPRKKRFYKKDKQGYYYIPEIIE